MSAALNKAGSKIHLDTGTMTSDALVAAKNIMAQVKVSWPGQVPDKHKCFWFVGDSIPDNTDYPDSIAPIGSLFTHLRVTANVVATASLYMKVATGSWIVIGAVAAAA